jgi:hypothetical protein
MLRYRTGPTRSIAISSAARPMGRTRRLRRTACAECRRFGIAEPMVVPRNVHGVPGTGLTGDVRMTFAQAVSGAIVLGRTLRHANETLCALLKKPHDQAPHGHPRGPWNSADRGALHELFGKSKGTISEHVKHIFEDGELDEASVVRLFRTTATDGKVYEIAHYNLDMAIAIGFRVRSPAAVRFRQWAADRLKEYIVKGFVLDDDRLKRTDRAVDYFDELLARIREIRASEATMHSRGAAVSTQSRRAMRATSTTSHLPRSCSKAALSSQRRNRASRPVRRNRDHHVHRRRADALRTPSNGAPLQELEGLAARALSERITGRLP